MRVVVKVLVFELEDSNHLRHSWIVGAMDGKGHIWWVTREIPAGIGINHGTSSMIHTMSYWVDSRIEHQVTLQDHVNWSIHLLLFSEDDFLKIPYRVMVNLNSPRNHRVLQVLATWIFYNKLAPVLTPIDRFFNGCKLLVNNVERLSSTMNREHSPYLLNRVQDEGLVGSCSCFWLSWSNFRSYFWFRQSNLVVDFLELWFMAHDHRFVRKVDFLKLRFMILCHLILLVVLGQAKP